MFENFEWGLWESIITVCVLIVFSAFFSAAETALTGASRSRMHALEKDGSKQAALVNRLRDRKDQMIGAILIGSNIVNTLSSAIATSVLIGIFGPEGVLYATGIMTVLLLIFSEVLPKTYALIRADSMAMRFAAPVRFFVWLFTPLLSIVSLVMRTMMRAMGGMNAHSDTEEELRGAIELHETEEHGRTQAKRAMLHSILDLADVEVGDIMTHRKNVETVDVTQPIRVVIDQVLDNAYSRLPVFRDDPDNIVGILHAKALLREISIVNGDFSLIDITKLLSDPWFIPETTILFDQLQAFRERKEHFAIVVDEYGAFKGIVTLEDILEEIVGDIDDEHDVTVPGVRAQPNGSFIVDGTVTIRDLNRALGWNLPDEKYSTVAGLVLHESKMIPTVGQNFSFYGYRFKILKRQRNQLTLIRVAMDLPNAKAA
ncbi:MAG: HlyC/CorC family transporter [Proteobacteria bacterium]|nr:HlyC/CorC family transporter [Pseudomonadota bacterium]